MCRLCGADVDAAACPRAEFLAGTLAGSASLAVGYPLDTVKVRMQNGQPGVHYRSTFHALRTILLTEGPRSLFQGIASPMVSCAPMNGLVFAAYRGLMRVQLEDEKDIPTLTQVAIAGTGTGIIGSMLVTPVELLKIRQQMAAATNCTAVPSTLHLARQLLRERGLRGLYHGLTVTALRDSGYGAYFLTYEATVRFFGRRPVATHDSTSPVDTVQAEAATVRWPVFLFAGGLAGITGWLATFPFDVLKTRVQASAGPTSMWTTARAAYMQGGARVFFAGLAPTLIRAIPVNMVNFGVFEATLYALSSS